MNKRLDYIDIAKGFAILFVLLMHRWPVPVAGRIIGSFYMPLFFFVSGYTAKNEGGGYWQYCKKKSGYVLLKYIQYSLILYLIWVVWSVLSGRYPKNAGNSLWGIVYSRFYLYPATSTYNIQLLDMNEVCNAPLWFLTAYVSVICVFYLTQYLADRRSIGIKWILLILIGITTVLSYSAVLLPWSIDTCFLCAMFMWAGKLTVPVIEHNNLKQRNIKWLILLSMLFLAAAIFNGNCNLSTRFYGNHGALSVALFAFTGIVGSALFVLICKWTEHFKCIRVFKTIGRHTLFLLGFHLLLYKVIDHLIEVTRINGSKWYMKHLADIIIVAITISILVLLAIFWERYVSMRENKKESLRL